MNRLREIGQLSSGGNCLFCPFGRADGGRPPAAQEIKEIRMGMGPLLWQGFPDIISCHVLGCTPMKILVSGEGRMDNIILIGMPGSGKSTVGVVLAKALGLRFLDVDLLIQEREGALLQELIDRRGVERFLDLERDAILSIGCQDNARSVPVQLTLVNSH